MVTLIFTFDVRSGQVQVKKVQILKIKILFKKTYLSYPVLSDDSKKWHLICRTTFRNSKNRASKVTSSLLLGFWVIVQPKIKIFAWNFVHLLVTNSSIMCIPFMEIYKISDFLKILFCFFVSKINKWKSEISILQSV